MEESIKRVEKLVHATNSALAQMKFSLMFDDVGEGKHGKTTKAENLDLMFLDTFLDKDGLKHCQDEFQLEANEMLAKVEKMFSSNEPNRKNLKALERIKEINKKKITKLEQSEPEGTEQSRQKLLSLISEEKFSPGVCSSKDSVRIKSNGPFDREKEPPQKLHPPAPPKIDSLLDITKTPIKTKVELKKKILETQEIVDRGFLTARQLAEKVDYMTKCDRKEKTPSTDKTISENNFKSLGSKTESNETIRNLRCKRHSCKKKRKEKVPEEVPRANTQVIDVKRKENQGSARSNLQLQRLPSVEIRGGLKLQKIHNLEIPASEETLGRKSNTAISFLSHERMEEEKMKKIVEKVRKENCCCIEESIGRNYVECFNCGKLIKIREARVDPQKVDEILNECNFNVFDPRIDEFVERLGTGDSNSVECRIGPRKLENLAENPRLEKSTVQSVILVPDEPEIKTKGLSEKMETKNQTEEPKDLKPFTLQEASNELFKKYRQEVEELEDNHLKLDTLLQNIFKKVDESRDVFDDCYFLKNLKSDTEKVPNLEATKPILVSLNGDIAENKKRQKSGRKVHLKKVHKNESKSPEPEKKPHAYSLSAKSSESNENAREKLSSFHQFIPNDKNRPNPKESQRRFSSSSTGRVIKAEHQGGNEEVDEKSSAELSTSSSSNMPDTTTKRKHFGKTLITASSPRRTRKPSDSGLSKEERLKNSFSATSPGKNETTRPSKMKERKDEEEKTLFVASSLSSNGSWRGQNKVEEVETFMSTSPRSRTVKALLRMEEVEGESIFPSSRNKINIEADEKTELFERSLEKSDYNYESDFESFTNELEGKEDDYEDEEPEVIECVKKLSTISEVDSELEKKISDEQKTPKGTNCELKDPCKTETAAGDKALQKSSVDLSKPKEGESVVSEISCKSKKDSEASRKSVPKELVTSLKDVLSALQAQFAKTETLADNLIENVNVERKENDLDLNSAGSLVLSPWRMPAPAKMVENLQSARKQWKCPPKSSLPIFIHEKQDHEKSEKSEDFPVDSFSDEGGSSLGEIIVSERRIRNSEKSGGSPISGSSYLNLDNPKKPWVLSGPGKPNSPSGLKLLT